jgi:hypothetical protein
VSDQNDVSDDGSDAEDSGTHEEPVARPKKRPRPASGRPAAKPAPSTSLFGVLIALAAAGIGAAGGWFGHDAQAKAKLRADSAPAAGSASANGPCAAWQSKICAGNDASAACAQAKAATELLTPSTCEVALQAVPATLAKLKAARAPCDKLVGKLCGDLPPGSKTCAMVRERTPSFPTERCTEMLEHYDEVVQSLKQMDQAAGAQQNAPGLGHAMGAPGAPAMPAAPGAP